VGPDRPRPGPRTRRRRQRRDHRIGRIVEGLLGAGATSTILLVASLAAMIGGGFGMTGMRYSEACDDAIAVALNALIVEARSKITE
jgi:hypothetical protein